MAKRIRGQLIDGFLANLDEPNMGLDRGGVVRFFSRGFLKLYPDLEEGHVLWQVLPSDPFVRWVSDCLDSTDPTPREQIMTHYPETLWMGRLEPIFGDQGRCSGWALGLHDVAPVEPVTQRLDSLLNEVRVGLSAPLASIKTKLEVLLEGAYKEEGLTVELLQQLNEDSNQLARLLFALEKPSTPQVALTESTEVLLQRTATEIQQTFEPLARSKNLALKFEALPDDSELTSVLESELKLCLTNLVDNAIKYTGLNGYGEISLLSLIHISEPTRPY